MADQQGAYATPRADLGEALEEYRRENGGNWIGTKVLPTIDVTKRAATFSVWPRASILQNPDVKRSARGKYNRITSGSKDRSYNTQNYGLEGEVDDSERAFFASDFDADRSTLVVVERGVRLAQERRVAAKLMSTTTFTGSSFTDHSADAPWTQESTDVVGHVTDGKEASRRRTGIMPNALVLARPAFNLLKKNAQIASRFKMVEVLTDDILEEGLAAIFGLKQILIGDEVYNAAAEGVTESVTDVWSSDYALLAYICPEGSPMSEPCLGRTFVWIDYASDIEIESYREEKIESDVIRVKQFCDEQVYDKAYGQLIKIQ